MKPVKISGPTEAAGPDLGVTYREAEGSAWNAGHRFVPVLDKLLWVSYVVTASLVVGVPNPDFVLIQVHNADWSVCWHATGDSAGPKLVWYLSGPTTLADGANSCFLFFNVQCENRMGFATKHVPVVL